MQARDGADQSVHNNLHTTLALKVFLSACVIIQLTESSALDHYDFSVRSADMDRFDEGSTVASQHTVPSTVHPDVHNAAVRAAASSAGVAMQPMMQ